MKRFTFRQNDLFDLAGSCLFQDFSLSTRGGVEISQKTLHLVLIGIRVMAEDRLETHTGRGGTLDEGPWERGGWLVLNEAG